MSHKPHAIGLQLNAEDWANINSLIAGAEKEGRVLDLAIIRTVVIAVIRNVYPLRRWPAHSSCTETFSTRKPPTHRERTAKIPLPWHCNTFSRIYSSARIDCRFTLSCVCIAAISVGQHYGKPVSLKLESLRMYQQAFKVLSTENSAWLTEAASVNFIFNKKSTAR